MAHVDEPGRWLYFLAGGREAGHDPYYSHLYRVRFDGSELTLLTPGNAHHEVKFSPDGRFFVDTYSTVADAPVHVLRSDAGATLLELGRADTSRLTEQGWTPQRFSAKAADGKTDIYGVLFLPRDFDEKQSYPLIDATYGANFRIQTPRSFLQDRQNAIALAQLGFVVMMVDGRGTPLRSQSMQDLGFGRWDVNLDDHVAAIRQLAERHRFIDADRVGVYGHSAGGFSTVHAMLEKPELFKVGFASAGSHDFDLFIHPSTNHQNFYRSGFTGSSGITSSNTCGTRRRRSMFWCRTRNFPCSKEARRTAGGQTSPPKAVRDNFSWRAPEVLALTGCYVIFRSCFGSRLICGVFNWFCAGADTVGRTPRT